MTKLQPVSVVDAVCEALRVAVIRSEIKPGTVITEQAVAEKYEVARTTAKAAVERLVADGFLQRSMHRSARVPIMTADDIEDLYSIRITLEVEALRRLASRRELPKDAERLAPDLMVHAQEGDHDRMAATDVAFHKSLVAAAGSPRIARMHSMIMGEAHICMVQVQDRHLLHAETIAREHAQILAAIREGDVAATTSEITGHLARARDGLLQRHGEINALGEASAREDDVS